MIKKLTKYLVLLFVVLASGQMFSPVLADTYSDSPLSPIQQLDEKSSSFRVEDTSTFPPTVINSGDTVDMGLASRLEIKQRVIRVVNTSTSNLCVYDTDIITGGPTFSISFGTGCSIGSSGIPPGLATSFGVQAVSNTPGTYTGTVLIETNQGNFSFKVRVRVLEDGPALIVKNSSGTIIGDSSTVNFGSTNVGQAVDQTFTVENNGDETLNITNLNVTGEGFSLIQPAPTSLQPAGEGTFKVRLLSQTGGSKSGEVEIFSNDANDSLLDFNLSGTVNVGDIQILAANGANVAENSTFNIGSNVPNNTPRDHTFRIRNTGPAPLTITGITVSGEGFSLLTSPSFPLQISANDSETFTVRLQSPVGGSKSGAVSISSDDPDENPYNFNLSGSVEGAPEPNIAVERVSGATVFPNGTVDLGNTLVNVPIEETFRIRNTGAATLSSINVSISGAGYSLVQPPPSSLTAGNSGTFVVGFLSNTIGTKPGVVSIQSNAPINNPFNFNLTATVQQPTPEISVVGTSNGGTLTLNSAQIGQLPVSRIITIQNTGTAVLQILNPNSIIPAGGCFTLTQPPSSTVAPNSSTSFTVNVNCQSVATHTTNVSIQNNDPNDNPFSFTLRIVIEPTPDTTPPGKPGPTTSPNCVYTEGNTCFVNDANFTIQVTPATDNPGGSGVNPNGYNICRSNNVTGWGGCNQTITTSGTTSIVVTGAHRPLPGQRYAYYFRVKDNAGNWSEWNDEMYIQTIE